MFPSNAKIAPVPMCCRAYYDSTWGRQRSISREPLSLSHENSIL